jgi:hypothetical protein
MKTVILLCTLMAGLVLVVLVSALPIRAQSANLSDNLSLVDLLPDIEKIYREALVRPHQEAAKHIYDEDIAEFYDLLLHKTGMDIPLD